MEVVAALVEVVAVLMQVEAEIAVTVDVQHPCIMNCFCLQNLTSPIMTCLGCALQRRRRRCNVCNEKYELLTPYPSNHPPPRLERVVINHPDGRNEEYWWQTDAERGRQWEPVGDGGENIPQQCNVCQLPESGLPGSQGQLPRLPFVSLCGHMMACSDCR